jgi:hypothetical protein
MIHISNIISGHKDEILEYLLKDKKVVDSVKDAEPGNIMRTFSGMDIAEQVEVIASNPLKIGRVMYLEKMPPKIDKKGEEVPEFFYNMNIQTRWIHITG